MSAHCSMDMDTEEEQCAMDTVHCDVNKRYTSVFLTEEDSAKLKEIAPNKKAESVRVPADMWSEKR